MPTYTFYLSRPRVAVPSFRIAECDGIEEAVRAATRELEQSKDAMKLEIFLGEKLVATILRHQREN